MNTPTDRADGALGSVIKYVHYFFGDDPDVLRLFDAFFIPHEFERATRPFPSPIEHRDGGVFGFGEQIYRVRSPFEESVFNVLQRMQKLEFFDTLVGKLREYQPSIGRLIGLLSRATSLQLEATPGQVDALLSEVDESLVSLVKRVAYVYVMSMQPADLHRLFESHRSGLMTLESESVLLLNTVRDTFLRHNEEAAAAAAAAATTGQGTTSLLPAGGGQQQQVAESGTPEDHEAERVSAQQPPHKRRKQH